MTSTGAFFLPIAFRFASFFSTAGAVFIVTAFCTWRFYRSAAVALPYTMAPKSHQEAGA